jgi:hypothetical protein
MLPHQSHDALELGVRKPSHPLQVSSCDGKELSANIRHPANDRYPTDAKQRGYLAAARPLYEVHPQKQTATPVQAAQGRTESLLELLGVAASQVVEFRIASGRNQLTLRQLIHVVDWAVGAPAHEVQLHSFGDNPDPRTQR